MVQRVRSRLAHSGGCRSGRACPLRPGTSDVNLFRYCKRVINLDAEISNRTLDLGVTEQELDRPQVAGAPIDQRRLGPPQRVGTNSLESSPMLAIHLETSRAYWRGVMHWPTLRLPVNRNSPGFLLTARR